MDAVLKEMEAWGASVKDMLIEAGLSLEEIAEILADE